MPSPRAINAGGARIRLTLADELQGGLRRAEYRLKAFGAKVGAIGRGLAKLSAVVLAPLAIGAKVFADFETQMAQVATMLDQPEKHMDRFRKGIRDMAVAFGESTEALAGGLYDILSASVAPEKALAVLEASARAAKAGITDTKTSADAITTVLNAYGIAAENAGDVSDFLFTVVKRGKTTFAELAPAIGLVATTAASAGVPLEEMGAALATMTRHGVRTENAVTALNSIVSAFLKPEKSAAKAAKDLGFELSSATIKAEGLGGVFQRIASLPPDAVAKIFPNVRAIRGVLPALKNIEGFLGDIELMGRRTGATEQAYKQFTKTLRFAFDKAKQSVIVLFGVIGEAISGPLKDFFNWMADIIGRAREWAAENGGLIRSIGKIALYVGGTGVALMALGGVIKAIAFSLGALTLVIKTAVISFVVLKAVLLALTSPIAAVVLGLSGLVVAFGEMLSSGESTWSKFGDSFKMMMGGIIDSIKSGDLEGAFRNLWAGVKALWGDAVFALEDMWITWKEAAQTVVYEFWDNFASYAGGVLGWVREELSKLFGQDDKGFQWKDWLGVPGYIIDEWRDLKDLWTESVGPSDKISRNAQGQLVPQGAAAAPSFMDLVTTGAERSRADALRRWEKSQEELVDVSARAMAKRMADEWDQAAHAVFTQERGPTPTHELAHAGDMMVTAAQVTRTAQEGMIDALEGLETRGMFRVTDTTGLGAATSVAEKQLDTLKSIQSSNDDIERNTRDGSIGVWG